MNTSTARIERLGGTAQMVLVSGEIDLATHDELLTTVHEALSVEGVRTVTVDLSDTSLLDSGGIGVLVAAHHTATRQRTEFSVIGATGMVARVLHVTGVWESLSPAPTTT